jgi:hypothetical protein
MAGSFIEVLLVVFLGYMAYEAVKIVIDRQIAKEAPAEKDEEAEVGGAGESRIATLAADLPELPADHHRGDRVAWWCCPNSA